MKEIFAWAPWFRELAVKIAERGEPWLIEKAKQVDWSGNPVLLKRGDQGIDPFSFVYSLAQKNTAKQRPVVYPSVAVCFGLKPPPDLGNEDIYTFPTPPPHGAACFNDGKIFNPDLLWQLFRQAVKDEPHVDPATFRAVLEIKYVALVKLTHALCLMNPDYFLAADTLYHVPANEGMDLKHCGHDEYMSAMDKAKQTFPGCRAYEINRFVFLQYMSKGSSPLLTPKSRFFQISTNASNSDCWEDFEGSYTVYTDAPGPGDSWDERTKGGDSGSAPYPLTKPRRGDVILVRTGVSRGRAIGVVHSNDYAEANGLKERSRLHVCWISKASVDFLGAQADRRAFTRTEPNSSTYKAFATAAPYKPTFALIDKATGSKPPDPSPPPAVAVPSSESDPLWPARHREDVAYRRARGGDHRGPERARGGAGTPHRCQAPVRRASMQGSDRDGDVPPEHHL